MKRTAQEISQYVGGELRGDGGTAIDSIASLKNAGPRDLSYADEKFNSEVAASRAGCVLVRSGALPSRTVILVKNPKLAFARAAAWLLAETEREIGIHPSHGRSRSAAGRADRDEEFPPLRLSEVSPQHFQAHV